MSKQPDITYQLHLKINRSITIKIGALGEHTFSPGLYVYTGSARRNLKARINRHLAKNKKIRWHIDYLTVHPDVQIIKVETFKETECQVNQLTSGKIVINGFGASDCRSSCGAHLKFVEEQSFT